MIRQITEQKIRDKVSVFIIVFPVATKSSLGIAKLPWYNRQEKGKSSDCYITVYGLNILK